MTVIKNLGRHRMPTWLPFLQSHPKTLSKLICSTTLSRTAIWVPKKTGENPFSFTNKTQMNSQNIKHAQDNHDLVAGAHGPGGLSGPPELAAPAPLERDSASLEGHNATLTRLRLTRGLDAPSGETPPRSRAGRPLGRDSASLEALMGSSLPHPLPRPEHLMF
jgi:hypothetical protein